MSNSVRPHRRQPTRLPRPWDSPGKNTGVGCHFLLQCMKVKSEGEVAQSCPTLSDPMNCSPSGSPVHGIFQARVLEWGANCASTFNGSAKLTGKRPEASLKEQRQQREERHDGKSEIVVSSVQVRSNAQTQKRLRNSFSGFLPKRM